MTRKHITGFIAAGVAGIAGLIMSGPRVSVDPTLRLVDLPEDLELYLSKSEAGFDDITLGTEKVIIWNDPETRERTAVSIVYLHGFSATRQEVAPLAELVARDLGANLFYTRLAGHGRSGKAMARASVNDWLNDASEAIAIAERLGDRVIVMGTSTGATLATWIATDPQLSANLSALVLLSPNFGPKDRKSEMLLWPWGKQLAQSFIGKTYEWEPRNDLQRRYSTYSYPTKALLQMMALVRHTRKARLEDIDVPVFAAFSDQDLVVDARSTREVLDEFGSSTVRIINVEDSDGPHHHVIAGRMHSPSTTGRLAEAIVAFIREEVGSGSR